MNLIEDKKIQIDLEVEINAIPKNYKKIKADFPLISRYTDFCNCKLKLLAGSEVLSIVSAILYISETLYNIGQDLNNTKYEAKYCISWEGMEDTIKEKLHNIGHDELYQFFDVNEADFIEDNKKLMQGILSDIGGLFNNIE